SKAKNPTRFSLKKNTLEAGGSYVVRVTVTSSNGESSSYDITVNVARLGVAAVLPDDFTIFESAALIVDGSDSKDLDFQSASLNYTWTCIETSPTSGGPCGSLTMEGDTLSFVAGAFATGSLRSLSFTLLVESGSYSDTAVVVVTFVTLPVPEIFIAPRALKYDPYSSIEITCDVSSPHRVRANWSSTDVVLGNVASTPLTRLFVNGKESFYLGIKANTLTAGTEYRMTVSVDFAFISTGSIGAEQTIVLTMNEPPSGGALTVSPLTGTTLVTEFDLLSSAWADDTDDYPLTFEFAYYSASEASQSIIREKTTSSNAAVYLPVGLAGDNYRGYCVVYTRDIYDTPGFVTQPVTVEPLSTAELTGVVDDLISDALDTFDSDKVTSVIASVMALLDNDLQNAIPIYVCTALNRDPQTTTPATCGPCKNKTCPADCSGQGECVLLDYNRVQIVECLEEDPYCRAECVCNDQYFGQYCGVSDEDLCAEIQTRASLCDAVNASLSSRDIDASAVTSIADSIAQIFGDISLVD
ncbi:unnamed protein product, partial [Ectocarpus fasciculatus]